MFLVQVQAVDQREKKTSVQSVADRRNTQIFEERIKFVEGCRQGHRPQAMRHLATLPSTAISHNETPAEEAKLNERECLQVFI